MTMHQHKSTRQWQRDNCPTGGVVGTGTGGRWWWWWWFFFRGRLLARVINHLWFTCCPVYGVRVWLVCLLERLERWRVKNVKPETDTETKPHARTVHSSFFLLYATTVGEGDPGE